GGNFQTFASAINTLSGCGIGGPVVFNVAAGSTYMEEGISLSSINGSSSTNTITFQKSGVGNNPVIIANGTSATHEAGFTISGTDYVTIDGIDISIGSGDDLEYGYKIQNATNEDGAQFNTI